MIGHGINREPSKEAKAVAETLRAGVSPDKCVGLTAREQKELAERIKAMSPEELAIVVENIPVEMCMARINSALARAAEFERSVKEACGMK